jgi:hypothetical protein
MASSRAAAPARPDHSQRVREIVERIGVTNEQALRYVLDPDPRLARMSRKNRELLIADLPPVTAGALLGPAALARHFVASAARGRYRDLFALWELFAQRPEECKPVLAERQQALEKARQALSTAVRLGLGGRAERVAEDVRRAQGLIWQWLREILVANLAAAGRRPAIASALLLRDPDLAIPLPDEPSEEWLAEAVAAQEAGPVAPAVAGLLEANAHRLPPSVATLATVHDRYPQHVPSLLDRVDLGGPEIGSTLAWARDHGYADRLLARIREQVEAVATGDRAEGLARWYAWTQRGIEVPIPVPLLQPTAQGLDLGRPETAILIARLIAAGAAIDPRALLEEAAGRNRQLAEKAYEAFVCAGLDVALPMALENNPIVKEGTRCPACSAWTWVRPGHERRCPRQAAPVTMEGLNAVGSDGPARKTAAPSPAS